MLHSGIHSMDQNSSSRKQISPLFLLDLLQGGHKTGKHGKPGKLKEFEKLSKSQGKLREI